MVFLGLCITETCLEGDATSNLLNKVVSDIVLTQHKLNSRINFVWL